MTATALPVVTTERRTASHGAILAGHDGSPWVRDGAQRQWPLIAESTWQACAELAPVLGRGSD